jgi:heptosyltransferase-3
MVPDAVNLASVQRALVVKLRHHGDVLLASPVLQVLKNRAPHVEIDALVYADTREMLEGHPALSRLHLIDRSWKRAGLATQARHEGALFSALNSRRYQLLVHLTDHWRGAWLAQGLRPRWSVAPARDSRAWRWAFSHRYPLPRGTPRHTVELDLDALRRLGIYPDESEKALVMVPGADAMRAVDALLAKHGLASGGFIQVHPTSRWLFKAWTEAANAELIRRLAKDGHRVVITGAPDAREKSIIGRILARARARWTFPDSSAYARWRRSRRARASSSGSTRPRCTSPRRWAPPSSCSSDRATSARGVHGRCRIASSPRATSAGRATTTAAAGAR